jgi:ubiquitin C-terminal hydrolase
MMIPNISREDMVEVGKYFNQESVIWGKRTGSEESDKFIFEYIEGDKTIQKRDVVLFDEEVQSREDYYSQERQSAGRKFYIPFFDDEYEMEEGQTSEYDLPPISEKQFKKHEGLIQEINRRIRLSLDGLRTEKSRWQQRQIARLRLRELKKKL